MIPTLLFSRFASHQVLSYDGAINFQVVESLAKGHGYVWLYNGPEPSPQYIETSGPFLFLAAFFVWAFGHGPATLQLANIVFLALLAAGIGYFVRNHRIAVVIGPALVLFLVPGISTGALGPYPPGGYGFGGYGEVAVAATALMSMHLMGAMFGERRHAFAAHAAFGLAGLAYTLKIIGIVCMPVLLGGLAMLLMVRPAARRRVVVLAPISAAGAPILFELYRLVAFGSWREYLDFWGLQSKSISAQAAARSEVSFWQKGLDHIHLLSDQTGVPAPWLCFWLVLPFALLLGVFLVRGERWSEWLSRPDMATTLMVCAYALLYEVWWVFVTPTEKAWLRRFLIGFIFINIAILRLVVEIIQEITESRSAPPSSISRRLGWPALGFVFFAFAGLAVSQVGLLRQAKTVVRASDAELRSALLASSELRRLSDSGYYPVGISWRSAAELSVLADVNLTDLQKIDVCGPVWAPRIRSGRVVVVWDQYSQPSVMPSPAGLIPQLDYKLISKPTNEVTIWSISSPPCPAN